MTLGREGGKEADEGKEGESSYLSLEAEDPFITDCLGDLLAPPPSGSSGLSFAALVYCPIMTLSTTIIRLLIARCRPSQWLNGGVMGWRIVTAASSEALSSSDACAGKDKINSSYHRLIAESCI